jgi:hypothetical protein
MTERLELDDAVELIRSARKTSVGAAIKLLTVACAEGVRARQRPCYMPRGDFAPVIPAFVWRDAHLDLDTGELYPAGTSPDDPPTEEGGYGHGGNGIITIDAADLRAWLRKSAPKTRGRPPKVDWEEIKRHVFALLDYQGAPNPIDPEWGAQAAVEKDIKESLERDGITVAESTVREHVSRFIAEWKAEKAEN